MHNNIWLRGTDSRGTWLDVLDSPSLLPHGCLVKRIDSQVAITLSKGALSADHGSRVEPRSPARFQHHFLVQLVKLLLKRMHNLLVHIVHVLQKLLLLFTSIVDIFTPQVGHSLIVRASRHRHHAQGW